MSQKIPYILTVIHNHRHGTSCYTALMKEKHTFSQEEIVKLFDIDFEEDRDDEFLEWEVNKPDKILD